MRRVLLIVALTIATEMPSQVSADHFFSPDTVRVEPATSGTVRVFLDNWGSRQGFHAELTFDPAVISVDSVTVGVRTAGRFHISYGFIAEDRLTFLLFDDNATRHGIPTGFGEVARIHVTVKPTAIPSRYTPIKIPAAIVADDSLVSITPIEVDDMWVYIGPPLPTALRLLESFQRRDGAVLVRWRLRDDFVGAATVVYRRSLPDGILIPVSESFAGSGPHEFTDAADEVRRGGKFEYHIIVDDGSEVSSLGSVAVTTENLVVPKQFALYQNRPNPFNPTTTIDFDVARPAYVSLKLYDVAGRLVRTLWDRQTLAGYYSAVWDGTGNHGDPVASGVYFCQLRAGTFQNTRKLVLLK